MLLLLALQLLISTAEQSTSFETLHAAGRNALLEARYPDAERLLKAAIAEADLVGIDNTKRANVMNDLAETYRHMDHKREAESYFKEALALLRKEPGVGRALIIVLNNFGAFYLSTEEHSRSVVYYQESQKIAKKTLSANDALVGNILNGLAAFHIWKGNFRTAEKYLVRALGIRERAFGLESLEVAEILNGLGNVQLNRKKFAAAEANLHRSLILMEKHHSSRHPDVATVLNNLGVVLHGQKKLIDAETILRRSLDIYRETNNARVAEADLNLAQLLISEQRFAEAEPLLKEAVTIRNSRNHTVVEDD